MDVEGRARLMAASLTVLAIEECWSAYGRDLDALDGFDEEFGDRGREERDRARAALLTDVEMAVRALEIKEGR